MALFGLHEAALIALFGVGILLFPRIILRISRWVGARHGTYQAGERSPVDDAQQAYQVASPALQQTSRRQQVVTLVKNLLRIG